MKTNGSMTIYKKAYGYDRHVIPAVMWQGTIGSQATERGIIIADSVTVFIPIPCDIFPERGDIIVFGDCPFEFDDDHREKNLRSEYQARTIMAVAVRNYGSPQMRHYEVAAV
jgi:hypothetical protein